ncbi:MAG: hypothetical protein Q9195_005654 [Heterodermia aff. obscurata]
METTDNRNRWTLPHVLFNNRDRPGGQLPPDLQDRISKSTAAWVKRENTGADPDIEPMIDGELIPPGYLDQECPRCGEIPDVVLLSNGNKIRATTGNDEQIHPCSHTTCSNCFFVPEQLKGMPCIFSRTTMVAVLDARHPEIYLSNEPVTPRNLRLLERHLYADFFNGMNPVPSIWQDLRVAIEQRKAYLHRYGDPRRREEYETRRLSDGLDPKICRQRIIDFRAMHVVEDQQQRLRRHAEAKRQRKISRYIQSLLRVSPQELEEDKDCHICMLQYYARTTDEGPVEVPVRLPCSHILGSACLWQWLMTSTTCPICRRVILPGSDLQLARD